jgi:hypothetical protein
MKLRTLCFARAEDALFELARLATCDGPVIELVQVLYLSVAPAPHTGHHGSASLGGSSETSMRTLATPSVLNKMFGTKNAVQ